MWDGHLGTIKATTNRIELRDDAKPSFQPLNQAGPKKREHKKKEIESNLNAEVVKPSTSEWATPVVFAPKKCRTQRFCIYY